MNRLWLLVIILTLPLLSSCGGSKSDKKDPSIFIKDTNAFDILMGQFAHDIENIWGIREVLIAGPKDFVKYSDNLKTRSHINFEEGVITVETISQDHPEQALHKAIVATLLMGGDPGIVNLYSENGEMPISTEPFLFNQVLDETGQPIRWEWRANHFADYLIENQLKTRKSGEHRITYITIRLVANHIEQRAHKYLPMIRKASRKYHVDESLVLAIMKVESSFNPYAVSRSDAIGLMQVQAHTAGHDIFQSWGYSGKPNRNYLFNPQNNINMGVAYIAMLRDRYLVGIKNPVSLRYAIITAYNGGAGSVLRVFSNNREQAIAKINKLSPDELYKVLTTRHPSGESRDYLHKVHNAHKGYGLR